MYFSLFDPTVSTTMNVFLVIANIINLVYNIPQIVKTIRTKSTNDFSEWFLGLRIIGNLIWVAYAININSFLLLLNSIIIGFYKAKELYQHKNFNIVRTDSIIIESNIDEVTIK
jgi:uncharacterized protein with PQ loop repeat